MVFLNLMSVCLLLVSTDVWLLVHIFREVGLLTLADLAKIHPVYVQPQCCGLLL